ncbi:MAG: hypothetical protein C4531_04085 [Desulfurivibrio sp.]|nr:MAG: hypothetical protein C4531_04085 [Desulfurivibrio sp.]
MKKSYKSGIVISAVTAAAMMMSGSQAWSHPSVYIKDGNNQYLQPVFVDAGIDGTPGNADDTYELPAGPLPAYSSKNSCGECHDYQAIERHSYHAQLGANQILGWNAWAMGNWNSEATQGKPWVQSPGHVGKW